jgi:hypothetical protein
MATRNQDGQVTETPRQATGAENSKNSFNVLRWSLGLVVIVGIGLFWYFGVIPGFESSPEPMPRL